MRQDIGQTIRSEISGDENIVWSGQPKGGYRWHAADIIHVPFSLILLGSASFIAFMSLTSPFLPIYLKAIFFLFVAIGIYFNSLKWVDKRLREQTFYGLTDISMSSSSPNS